LVRVTSSAKSKQLNETLLRLKAGLGMQIQRLASRKKKRCSASYPLKSWLLLLLRLWVQRLSPACLALVVLAELELLAVLPVVLERLVLERLVLEPVPLELRG
jgi:hypothetical protein